MHRMNTAVCYFKNKFPDLKYTTVCERRKATVAKIWKDHEVVTELEEKRLMLSEDILSLIIRAICDSGDVINIAIVIAAGLGLE